jgi:hypothetical protein
MDVLFFYPVPEFRATKSPVVQTGLFNSNNTQDES